MERPNPGRETGANGPENGADEEPRPRNNAEINEDRRERDGRATAGAEPERPSTPAAAQGRCACGAPPTAPSGPDEEPPRRPSLAPAASADDPGAS
ncbi:hypothetical protein GCM10009605_38770 [Nocardiopsis composta]